MTSHANFAPERVADAIRTGLREGRRPVRMSVVRAVERAVTHRNMLTRYREHAQQSLDSGDYLHRRKVVGLVCSSDEGCRRRSPVQCC